jgi:hypothetical protein
MDALMLDGNAIAGLLQEVFAVEMTTALGTCNACGAPFVIGATHVFRGAGFVMRCARCDNALVTIVKDDTRTWIGMRGIHALQVVTSPANDLPGKPIHHLSEPRVSPARPREAPYAS